MGIVTTIITIADVIGTRAIAVETLARTNNLTIVLPVNV
jgi:hypothetical protein